MKPVRTRIHKIKIAIIVLLGVSVAAGGYYWGVQYIATQQVLGLNTAPVGKQWKVLLSEEFSGTSLNLSRWKPYHNTYGDGNEEEACLTPNNINVSGGSLKIVAKKESVACPGKPVDNFTSGFMGSRDKGIYYPAFARYEMRAKLPHGQGLWPAFWLRHKAGSSTAEVDVMEYFHAARPGQASQTLHFPNEINYNTTKVNNFFETPTATPGWHTWAVEILAADESRTKAKFIFYQDGLKTHEYTPTKFGWLNNHDKNAMFDIAINLAVGGKHAGHPSDSLAYSRYTKLCLKPARGTPPCDSTGVLRATFPSSYEVDYVRVYTLENKPAPAPSTKPSPQAPAAQKPSSTSKTQESAGGNRSGSTAFRSAGNSVASKQNTSHNSGESSDTKEAAVTEEQIVAPEISTLDVESEKQSRSHGSEEPQNKSYDKVIIYGATGLFVLSSVGAIIIARRAKLL